MGVTKNEYLKTFDKKRPSSSKSSTKPMHVSKDTILLRSLVASMKNLEEKEEEEEEDENLPSVHAINLRNGKLEPGYFNFDILKLLNIPETKVNPSTYSVSENSEIVEDTCSEPFSDVFKPESHNLRIDYLEILFQSEIDCLPFLNLLNKINNGFQFVTKTKKKYFIDADLKIVPPRSCFGLVIIKIHYGFNETRGVHISIPGYPADVVCNSFFNTDISSDPDRFSFELVRLDVRAEDPENIFPKTDQEYIGLKNTFASRPKTKNVLFHSSKTGNTLYLYNESTIRSFRIYSKSEIVNPKEEVAYGLNSIIELTIKKEKLQGLKILDFIKTKRKQSFYKTLWDYYAKEVNLLKCGDSIITNSLTDWICKNEAPSEEEYIELQLWNASEPNLLKFTLNETNFVKKSMLKSLKNNENMDSKSFCLKNSPGFPIVLSILFLSQKEGQITRESFKSKDFVEIRLNRKSILTLLGWGYGTKTLSSLKKAMLEMEQLCLRTDTNGTYKFRPLILEGEIKAGNETFNKNSYLFLRLDLICLKHVFSSYAQEIDMSLLNQYISKYFDLKKGARKRLAPYLYPIFFNSLSSFNQDVTYNGVLPINQREKVLSLCRWLFVSFFPDYLSLDLLLEEITIASGTVFKLKNGSLIIPRVKRLK